VADSRNNLIRKIAADGTVSHSPAAESRVGGRKRKFGIIFFPTAIAVGADGMVYVADTHNS